MWDPQTGRREVDRSGEPAKRPKAAWTQCELYAYRELHYPGNHNTDPCPKGHWKDDPDLTADEEAMIDLFMAARAAGSGMLTEAERGDPFVLAVFAGLAKEEQLHARRVEAEHHQVIIAAINGSR